MKLLLLYFILSELLFIVSLIKFLKYKTSKDTKKYPILYSSELKTRMFMFGTCIWLPYIIYESIK
jgi:hypothetical protein